ncbi:hypothetical protein [Hymenobacter ruricola]|uniref:T9SS type A sorting domain-containing protein n=1 Tax=Hymenobacter ruricola TaxID=2791023 RepID=A0ABS0I6K2_9BACT|nr:hypothetical protein [Hymenobacter ruricola]MBF9222612.1 hypothetical protein [Hymenobacter ruricola]
MRYVFFLLLLAAQTAFGQCCPYMQPVKVLPANPTATDDVRLVFQATTGGRGAQLSGSLVRAGNALTYTSCYYSGPLAQPQTYLDTVRVGQLPTGSYTVSFIGIQSCNTQCVEQMRNSTSATFQVSGALATRTAAEGWAVYPVPATGSSLTLWAPADKAIQRLQLLDAAGRSCFEYAGSELTRQGNEWQLCLPALPAGLYSLRIGVASGEAVTQRVLLP